MSSSVVNLESYLIPLDEINRATENFSQQRCIGDGGYGAVYKGQLSERWKRRIAAVKRLNRDGYQGEREFRNELEMISRFQNENIISFIGYCDEGGEMIIVNEYAINGSLDYHIEDASKICCITWAQRLRICIGAARGLNYLHSGLGERNRVIHRDVKSANILLDANLVAKICDFGLSKLGPRNEPNTQLNTKIAGTKFYLDPTYLESGILCKESDVYSFGVVLFEMLSGMLVFSQRTIENDGPQNLMNFIRRYYPSKVDKLIDPHIRDKIDTRSFNFFKEIAYECISFNLKERPTMQTVIDRLERALACENIRVPPVFGQNANHDYDSNERYEGGANDNYFQPLPMNDGGDSYVEEDGPRIEYFQIIGDANPGGKLLGCGTVVRGISQCFFQWVRHFPDGATEYIEGATKPEYVVTADDVDKLIALECIPTDGHGRQGQIVRLFANEQNKIMCDPEMQQEIDRYMAAGQASFSVLLMMDTSLNSKPTTFTLRRSNYQVKINRTQEIFIQGKYTNDVSIKIPLGLTSQFVLTYSDGSSHPFSTFNDVRMRDTLVLTMRMFQSKTVKRRTRLLFRKSLLESHSMDDAKSHRSNAIRRPPLPNF